ncbi:MAG TPA: heparinase II/III family protein [Hyphomicrobiaceae bacterium]
MSLTLAEQTRLARLATDRVRRAALARLLSSRLLRWRYGAPVADELLIVPQELRTADPSFADEIAIGQFGLGGAVAYIGDGSPFDLKPPSLEWARELHGFGWLRHLRAAETEEAQEQAIDLVTEWIRKHGSRGGIAWEPPVIGRRLISWICSASLLLDGVDQATYDRIADSLGDQLIRLSATWRDAPAGYPRLLSLTALVFGDLCIAGHDQHLREIQDAFAEELETQILPDGGHISRNPGVPVELLLDFLPLRQCFSVRERPVPPALDTAIERMMPHLRFMRLGDGSLARFNGMGAPNLDLVATVLAYGDPPSSLPVHAPQSGYARLACGDVVVIADVGSPPPLELAGQAHAGCLSFEMSAGKCPVFVNCGAPGAADQDWRAASRATAGHNTLCLGGKSSSRLVLHDLLETLVGSAPIRFPSRVSARVRHLADGGISLTARHDGYHRQFGLIHRRSLVLDPDGNKLTGTDSLGPLRGSLRLKTDLPFAIHFHLHPEVGCNGASRGGPVEIVLPNGERWAFTAKGAHVSIEDSFHCADLSGPRRALQIVLRGACYGESEVRWEVERRG